jgi:MerR family transcriptional regulator, thiopeptide resistance regulator
MDDWLDIRDVVRRTGLTSRALRFYEARGLVAPLRTHTGRRLYGARELERLNQIVALKRAGLTLAQIQRLGAGRSFDLARLVDLQLEALDARRAEIDEARALLLSVKSRIDRGEPVDAATFCSLIRHGDSLMEQEKWRELAERHATAEELEEWRATPPPEGFDQQAYARRWQDLGARIEAALPLDPASRQAQAFLDEWQALLKPFLDVATPAMKSGAERFWQKRGEWEGEVKAPFSAEVSRFIAEAGRARGG